MYQNLEYRVGNSRQTYADNYTNNYADKSKMNGGEKFIARILDNERIRYKYEPRLCTENTYHTERGEKSYLRLHYPDFSIEGYGFMIEYIGKPDDKKYIEGVETKKKIYEQMGIPVLYINRDDIYEQRGGKRKLRKDAYENVRRKILDMTQKIWSSGLAETSVHANKFKDYVYKSRAA